MKWLKEKLKILKNSQTVDLFCRIVTIRGISRIFKVTNSFLAFLWIFSVIVSFSILVWQMVLLFVSFFDYPYTTMVKEGKDTPIFPHVTVCNLNPVYFENILPLEKHIKNVESCLVNKKFPDLEKIYKKTQKEIKSIIEKHETSNGYFSNFPKENNFLDQQVNRNPFVDFNFWDWDLKKLEIKAEVEQIWHPIYYRCFTLKVPKEHQNEVSALSTVLYLNNFPESIYTGVYNPSIFSSKATGIKFLLHYPNTYPEFEGGVSIGPGSETTFSMQLINRIRLGLPYNEKNCTKTTQQTKDFPYLYSPSSCLSICIQEEIIKECGCVSMNHYFTEKQFLKASKKLCGNMTTDKSLSDLSCPNGISSTPQFVRELVCQESKLWGVESDCSSHCFTPCSEFSYHFGGESAPWPDPSQQLSFFNHYISNNTNLPNKNKFNFYQTLNSFKTSGQMSDSEIMTKLKETSILRDNFLQINVNFEDDFTHFYKDVEMISVSSFISSVGGTLSLWLDITAMTFVELVEFIYMLGYNFYRSDKSSSHITPSVSTID